MEPEIEFGSVEEQEVAEPATDSDTVAAEDGVEEADIADRPPQDKKGNQDAAVASAAAAARRQAENKYREAISTHMDQKERFAKSQGFSTWEEMENKSVTQSLQRGVTPQAIELLVHRAVEQSPIIREAREQKNKAQVKASFDEFTKEFPQSGIETMADFIKMPNYDAFYNYVNHGLSLSEAYTLTNRDAIVNQKAAAAKQAALNTVYGKAHLRSNAGGGDADDVVVPRDTYKSYRQMMPEWTDRQIREHYKRST